MGLREGWGRAARDRARGNSKRAASFTTLQPSPYSGPCTEGYFCPSGSSKSEEVPCGDPSLYCPTGSPSPLAVQPGWYTVNGSTTTRSAIAKAPRGHYAMRGLLYECPAGRYGWVG